MAIQTSSEIAVVWCFDQAKKTQTAVNVGVASAAEQDALKKQYPAPEYDVQVFRTSRPENFEIKAGQVYELGFDPFDVSYLRA